MYQCKYCGQEFENRFKCSGHASRCLKNPTTTSKHICKYCGKEIVGKHSHTQHENHCEQNPQKMFYNSETNFTWNTPEVLYCSFCDKQCKNKNSLIQHEKRCKENPNRLCISQTEAHGGWPKGKPAWNKGLTKDSDTRVANQSASLKQKYAEGLIQPPFLGRHHTEEVKEYLSDLQLSIDHDQVNKNSHGKRGWLDNMFFMSTWEVAYYIFMRDMGYKIVRCPYKYEYQYQNKKHTYTPDFLVNDTIIVEVKGYETDLDRLKYTLVPSLVIIDSPKIDTYIEYVKSKYQTDKIESLYDINLSK